MIKLTQFDPDTLKPKTIAKCSQVDLETDTMVASVSVNADGSLSILTRCKGRVFGDGCIIMPRSGNMFDLTVFGHVLDNLPK